MPSPRSRSRSGSSFARRLPPAARAAGAIHRRPVKHAGCDHGRPVSAPVRASGSVIGSQVPRSHVSPCRRHTPRQGWCLRSRHNRWGGPRHGSARTTMGQTECRPGARRGCGSEHMIASCGRSRLAKTTSIMSLWSGRSGYLPGSTNWSSAEGRDDEHLAVTCDARAQLQLQDHAF